MEKHVTGEIRRLHDEFLAELHKLGYSKHSIETYDKGPANFIRWLEGTWAPQGPRRR
jgi:hypothetical protein